MTNQTAITLSDQRAAYSVDVTVRRKKDRKVIGTIQTSAP